jgi:muconate cycloisomerase
VKVSGVETYAVKLPSRRVHSWSTSTGSIGSYVILKLLTDDGVVGLGESPMFIDWSGDHQRYSGESAITVKHVIADYLLPAIEGEDVFAIERIHEKMDRVCKGHFYAKAAVDIALYDAMGKALGTPVYNLLGGAYRSEVPLAHSLGVLLTPKECAAEADTVVQEGIKTVKLKVGLDESRDVTAVREVRQAIGPSIELTLDVNQAWPTPKHAIRMIRKLESYDIAFVEQPCDGLEALAQIAQAVETPIMADESAWSPFDALALARERAADYISLYTTKPGGLFRAKKVAAVAEAAGMRCNVNGSAESGVGNAANLHLIAALRIVDLANVIPVTATAAHAPTRVGGRYYTDDIVTEPFAYRGGFLRVPEAPGLGVTLDEAKLKKYSIV